MLGNTPTWRLTASLVLAVGVALAMPLAGAFGMGVDAASASTMKSAGAAPAYGQIWVGQWIEKSGWGGVESDLKELRDLGITPVIQWYYWGDSISPNCVANGCDGRTKAKWDAMAKDMATRAKNIMGSKEFYVVLEPEFQKNGIQSYENFDGYLAAQANSIRGIAPNAKIVVGFGHWGNWDIFDRAVAASQFVGFQVLRGSTRDSAATAIGSADYMITLANQLKARWGKPIVVFDLGISTYGGWEGVQEKALQGILAKRAQLDAAGVKVIVWRYVSDNGLSSGYFGAAEKTWGVKTSSGAKKPGYDELVKLIQGGSGGTPSAAPSPTTSSGSFSVSFTGVQVMEWWIQTGISSSQDIAKVEARVNGGAWVNLDKQSWGGYAKSIHVLSGQNVELRATSTSGATAMYTAQGGSTSAPAPSVTSASFDPSFSGVKVMEWWVQTSVSGTGLSKVEARVNGGGWVTLDKQSWGGYAKSIHVLKGQKVEFRATSTSGTTATSATYTW